MFFSVDDDAPAETLAWIDAGLDDHNVSHAPLDAVRRLVCVARDSTAGGGPIGGALAQTWGHCCELQQLFVEPAHRGTGVGSRLIALVEQRALERGCTLIYLDTFTFQSPALYRRLGYVEACRFDGFPDGIVKFTLCKDLRR